MAAISCLNPSPEDSERCGAGSSPVSSMLGSNSGLLLAAGATVGTTVLGGVTAYGSKTAKKFLSKNLYQLGRASKNFGFSACGMDPGLVELVELSDQLELKFELLKVLTPGGEPEVEKRYRIVIDAMKAVQDAIQSKVTGSGPIHSSYHDYNRPGKIHAQGMERVQAALSLPLRAKVVELTASEAKAKLGDFFGDTFEPSVRKFFEDQAVRVIANSELESDSEFRDRQNIYLMGPGGTGKTDSVQAFARVFDLPFCKIEASSLTPQDFMGSSSDRGGDGPIMGKLLECMLKSKSSDGKTYLNGVLFIDEMDHLFNSKTYGENFEQLFKPLLSGETFTDKTTGIEIDASHLIVVGAGNGPLLNRPGVDASHVDAMNRRFSILEYKKLDLEKRTKVGVDKFLKNIAKARQYAVTSEDEDFVRNVLVPYDHERMEGVGGLKEVINTFVIHRKNGASCESFDYKTNFSRTLVSVSSSQNKRVEASTQTTEGSEPKLPRAVLESMPEEELQALLNLKESLRALLPQSR